MPSLFHAENISHMYADQSVLNGISFQLQDTGISAFTGSNGVGKTTLLRIIAGLQIPTKGIITGVQNWQKGWLGSDESGFLWNLTGRENIDFFAKLQNQKTVPKSAIGKLIEFSGFEQALDTQFVKCSAGMKKLLLLCHCISSSPQLLILDEPFNHLDPENQKRLAQFINEYALDHHVALSSHSNLELLNSPSKFHIENRSLN